MIPLKTNIHVQAPKGTTVELFALRKPFASLISSDRSTLDGTPSRVHSLPPLFSQSDNLARGRAAARRRRGDQSSPSVSTERSSIGKPNHSPQPSRVEPSNAILASVRSELDATRIELARCQSDSTKLAEKYRILERVLQDAKDALRSRDKQIEDLKRERDFAMADRRSRGPVRDFDRRPLMYDARRSSSTRSPSSRTAYDSDHDHDLDDLSLLKSASPYRSRRNKSLPPVPRTVTVPHDDGCPPPGLEVFLTKTDSWSGAQVIQAVQDLNSEILQLSAGATESITLQGRGKASLARMNQATKGVSSRLGAAFARLLASRDHSEEPALLQFGLQACVATCVTRLLNVFCVGLPLMPNELFLQLHTRMHAIEPQATSSRWRALTLAHLRALNPRLEEAAVQDLITQILRAWADILVLCGCAPSEVTLDALRPRFGTQTQRVVRSACALGRVLHEDIMSTNFEVILAEQGRPFNRSCMADAFGTFEESSSSVLCSTELGLRCSTKKNARAAADGLVEGSVDQMMLLLPKVILDGVADILDGKGASD
ncbi:hypothetical protein B0F90DRAFT_1709005 [Multifurca ochricompacta]|uniref:Uncharacterized protein n=1 Tax=Multifurca ochricompacta TaxID=376703 RepID=A0AAD4M766_9AGAM|nr:hypothetical protein B0F90DRAFT_1709005 [Multifurca ochricompacta]